MGNSTRTLQDVVDGVSSIGDLNPVFTNTGGYAAEPALTIGNAALSDLIAKRWNHKWNRFKIPAFLASSNQQDYAGINIGNLGWIESAARVDVNNTSVPKPVTPIEVVRDLPFMSWETGPPAQIAWMNNDQMEYGTWPGASVAYVNPIGAVQTPVSPPTNITDAKGNILVLTTWGITGTTPPAAAAASAPGTPVTDGSCVWTVANPKGAGFRLAPVPPGSGNVWLVRVFGQLKAPRFTSLGQTLDPIPDDYSKWFEDGFIAYAHRHSANPAVQRRYPLMKKEWLDAMAEAAKQSDREPEYWGFTAPSIVQGESDYGLTAAWPYPGRRRG